MIEEGICATQFKGSKTADSSKGNSSKSERGGNATYEDVVTLQVPATKGAWSRHRKRRSLANIKGCCVRQKHKAHANRTYDIISLGSLPENHAECNYSAKKKCRMPSSYTTLKQMGNGKNERTLENNGNSQAGENPEEPTEQNMVWTTNFLAAISILLIILTFPFSLFYCIRIVAEYERAVVLRMGNLIPKGKGTKGPGLFFILPCIDSVRKVDLRTITFAIPPQELLTRDSVTVSVDAVVYYRVLNPVASVLNIEDATRSTRLLAQTTIRNVLGTKDLAQILMDRDEISVAMQSGLDSTTDAWGVKVERVEIKNVRLPIQLQRAMAAEAEAAREARAKVIAAEGEQAAARSLKKAARVISTSPLAFQLRYLQTLCAISAEKNSTILFPVPIDMMQNLGHFTAGLTSGKYAPWIKSVQNITAEGGAVFTAPVKSLPKQDDQRESWAQDDADTHSDTV